MIRESGLTIIELELELVKPNCNPNIGGELFRESLKSLYCYNVTNHYIIIILPSYKNTLISTIHQGETWSQFRTIIPVIRLSKG